jgi:hypothetical protein
VLNEFFENVLMLLNTFEINQFLNVYRKLNSRNYFKLAKTTTKIRKFHYQSSVNFEQTNSRNLRLSEVMSFS